MNRVRNRSLLAATVAAAVFAAGCQTVDPYTGEQRTSRAAMGAGIGALAGGAVGAYQDRQEAKLREQLAGTGVSVTRDADYIILNMPGNVTFDTNSSALKPEFFEVLNSVALVVNEFDQTIIEAAGHTDITGPRDFNMTLSQRRAESVASYLSAQRVNSQRIMTVGMGPDKPVATNDTADGRALNRRVELTLVPIQQG